MGAQSRRLLREGVIPGDQSSSTLYYVACPIRDSGVCENCDGDNAADFGRPNVDAIKAITANTRSTSRSDGASMVHVICN